MCASQPDQPVSRRVLLLAAMHHEIGPTVARLGLAQRGGVFSGALAAVSVTAAVTGVGGERAVAAVERLVGQHRPDVVLFIGFAGGLNPALVAGDVLSVGRVQDERGDAVELEGAVDSEGSVVPGGSAPLRPQLVVSDSSDDARSLITVDRLVHRQAMKAELFDRHSCDAVDMETYPVARLLRRLGVRLCVLRAVCDSAGVSIPAQAVGWVTPDGRAKPVAAACYAGTHPWRVPEMLRLKRCASLAADRLAVQAEATIRAISQS